MSKVSGNAARAARVVRLVLLATALALSARATNIAVRAQGASLAAILQAALQESAASAAMRRALQNAEAEPWRAGVQGAADEYTSAGVSSRAEWQRWQARLPRMTRSARRGSFDAVLQRYQAARQAFFDAFSMNTLHAMSLAFSDAELFLAQLRSLYPADAAPPDVPRVPEPEDMRRAYRTALHNYRTNWVAGLHCDAWQAGVLRTIFSARSLHEHTALLEAASTGAWPTVTLAWLSRVYQDLSWQEPYVFAYWYGRGNARALLGDIAGAHQAWRAALRFFPDTIYVHYHCARTCGTSDEDHRRALRHFEWITTATKDPLWRTKAYCHMARRLLERGECAQALEAAQHAVGEAELFKEECAPWLIEARHLQSTALLRSGQPDKAVAALEQAVTAFPRDVALKRDVADLLYGLATAGGTNTVYAEHALRWYEKVIADAGGERPELLARMAHLQLLCGRVSDARNAAVRELALDPGSVHALTTLGYTYAADGDHAKAAVFFRKALDIDPAYAPARHGLAALEAGE